MTKPNDRYSEEETQKRFMQSLKAAMNTAPKPLKSMSRKRKKVQRKPKKPNE
jgi:hypothetical protein